MGENDNDDENENEKRDRDRARSRRVSCAGGWLVPLFREAARLVAEIPRVVGAFTGRYVRDGALWRRIVREMENWQCKLALRTAQHKNRRDWELTDREPLVSLTR